MNLIWKTAVRMSQKFLGNPLRIRVWAGTIQKYWSARFMKHWGNNMVFIEKGQRIDIEQIKSKTRLSGQALANKNKRDQELARILSGQDDRILLVIGPCSSDNEDAVLEYARRLSELQKKVEDRVFIVMRVYTAKPRTNGDGYKGLVHQPDTSKAPSLINGIQAVRQLHYRVITETGLTTADEMLYPTNLRLVDDLVSYHAVGARSVEDQEHRRLVDRKSVV